MDGQNQNRDSSSGHNDLSHDEAVSLRAPALPRPALPVTRPYAQQPSAAARDTVQPTIAPSPAPAYHPSDTQKYDGAVISEQPVVNRSDVGAADQLPNDSAITDNARAPYDEQDQPFGAQTYGALASETVVDTGVNEGEVEISWTASEFIAHDKTPAWYGVLAAITVVGSVLAYVISDDWVTVVAILICAGMFGFVAGRQPRQLEFVITTTGIGIGPKFYSFRKFRSYSVVVEGAFASIDFMPLRRFDMPISVYYDPQHEQRIMELLSRHLPLDQHKHTLLETLMHRVRF